MINVVYKKKTFLVFQQFPQLIYASVRVIFLLNCNSRGLHNPCGKVTCEIFLNYDLMTVPKYFILCFLKFVQTNI